MRENEAIERLRTVLIAAVPFNYGYVLEYQPTQEGLSSDPTIYINVLFQKRYGFRGVTSTYDSILGRFKTRETQVMEMTVQFNASRLPTTDAAIDTPFDMLMHVAGAIQSDNVLHAIRQVGLRPLRITDVRIPRFKDDSNRWAQSPNFDLVLQYDLVYEDGVPAIDTFELEVIPVPDII